MLNQKMRKIMEIEKEKINVAEIIKAMMVKSINEIATKDLKVIADIASAAIYERAMMAEQAAMENGSTRREELPDPSLEITPPMMRRAIEKALALEVADSRGRIRKVFSTKKKWLAVLRVMQYFGIVMGNNLYKDTEYYIINKVYPDGVPIPEVMRKIMPNPNAMSKAGGEMALIRPLEDWLSGKYDEQLGDYLVIARCLLKSITDEMLSYPPKA